MATNKVQNGNTVDWTNATGDPVTSGSVVTLGDYGVGIATVDIANAAVGSVDTQGVYRLPKHEDTAFAQGAAVYYNTDTDLCVTAPGEDVVFAGFAWRAAAGSGGPEVVDVKLAPFGVDPAIADAAFDESE